MNLEVELDLSDMSEEDVERSGRVPPGWYRTVVDDVSENDISGAVSVSYKVSAGPWKGAVIFDYLTDPESAADDDKAKKAKQRLAMFCKRLGLIKKDDFGHAVSVSLTEAIGKECYVKASLNKYKDNQGQDKENIRPDFAGIFALDDERVPKDVRAGKLMAEEAAVPKAATKAQVAKKAKEMAKADPYGDL